jgi:hypothetical protein
MKNTITTLILALLVFSGCVNSTKQNTQQNEVICEIHHQNCNKLAKELNMSLDEYHKEYQVKDEAICKIHYLNCNKLAKESNMSLNEYHKWQEEQKKAAKDEDNATDENGDIVGPEDEDDGRFVHIENDDNINALINKIRAEKKTSEYSNNTTIKETRSWHSCQKCNVTVNKPYIKNCNTEWVKEKRTGYVLCWDCQGYGFLTTNVNCSCGYWCYKENCYVSKCHDGWIECSECRGEGEVFW